MTSRTPPQEPRPATPKVDARTLWAGGAATALVVALIALVGVLVFRGVFDIPVLAREGEGTWGYTSTTQLMATAAAAALLATALLHVLLLTMPRARSFFGWIVGLLTVASAIAPFATGAELDSKVATAVIHAVIGIAILSLLSGIARAATPRRAVGITRTR